MFYNGNLEEGAWEAGRYSAEKALTGIYKIFVKFGQIICLPISPLCSECPIEKYCKKINVKNHR